MRLAWRAARARVLTALMVAATPAYAQDDAAISQMLQQMEQAQAAEAQGRFANAEPAWREVIRLQQRVAAAPVAQSPERRDEGLNRLGFAQRKLATNLMQQERLKESLAQWQEALATTQQWVGNARPGPARATRELALGGLYINLAQTLGRAGRAREDEDALRAAIALLEGALAQAPGADGAQVLATALYNLGTGLVRAGRHAEAEPVLARALALREQALGAEHPLTQNTRMNLAAAYSALGRAADAEALHRRLAQAWERSKGALHGDTLFALELLAADLDRQGDLAGGEKLLREVLVRYGRMSPVDLGWQGGAQYALALRLARLGRTSEALPLADQAAQQLQAAYGERSPQASNALQLAGQLHLGTKDAAAAVQRLRPACQAFGEIERRQERSAAVGAEWDFSAARRGRCATVLTAALAQWAAAGGGGAGSDSVPALQREAWLAAQDAQLSAAGIALSRSGARAVAAGAGASEAAEQYERALDKVQAAERGWAEAQRPGRYTTAPQRDALLREVGEARERQRVAAQQLQARAPAYWDLRSPRPLPVAELQRRGAGALLGDDEALLMWLQTPDLGLGVVLAVSARDLAVARIALAPAEVDALVRRLREQIDPCAWGVANAQCTRLDTGEQRGFDAQAAWALHQALLGDAGIARVLNAAAIKTWLVVPTGSLTSLPPGLLLTQAPPTGTPLARLPWLLRDKAIALLPTVAALRTLRQGAATAPAAGAGVPLFMLANPDFSGRGAAAAATQRAVPRAAANYLSDGREAGRTRADALAQLPPLPGTAAEAAFLRQLLSAREADVLQGREAREAVLRERGAALARSRVLAFATHGLVTGDLGATEPGLALAAPSAAEAKAGDDGVLAASEVARLRLSAEWVLLSACNTAAPDANNAQGLSGLARAFFHAGAHALLVSHWRVDDEATQALISRTLAAQQASPALGKAQALRQASLAVMRGEGLPTQGVDVAELEDLRARRAHPAAWAAFTLVGEAR